jgi:hypothetical protein
MFRIEGSAGLSSVRQLPGVDRYDAAWIGGLTPVVRDLHSTGAQVLVLEPIPDPIAVVPNCLSDHLDDVAACSIRPDPTGTDAERAAIEAGVGLYVTLTDLFCTATLCPAIVGNIMVHYDGGHLTSQYSELLAPAMGAPAAQALARRRARHEGPRVRC